MAEYDRLKRFEQRAMQNVEAEEVKDKKARFVLFDKNGNQFTEASLLETPNIYHVLWIDSKLKNYEMCVDYYQKKQRITHASIQPILIVEKRTIMDRILELWAGDHKKKKEIGESISMFTP